MVFGLAVRVPAPLRNLVLIMRRGRVFWLFHVGDYSLFGFDEAHDGFDLAPRIAFLCVKFSAFFLGEFSLGMNLF